MRLPMVLRDLSHGGFGLESTISIPAGSEHQFRFTAEDGASFVITAVSTHCDEVSTGSFVTGFQFVEGSSPAGADPVRDLIDKINRALTF
jgi:hypothetical protein